MTTWVNGNHVVARHDPSAMDNTVAMVSEGASQSRALLLSDDTAQLAPYKGQVAPVGPVVEQPEDRSWVDRATKHSRWSCLILDSHGV